MLAPEDDQLETDRETEEELERPPQPTLTWGNDLSLLYDGKSSY
jgi:hypothetical protein